MKPFYKLTEGENPTQRNKQLSISNAQADSYAMDTVVRDETMGGVPTRILSSMMSNDEQSSGPIDDTNQTKWAQGGIERELYDSINEGRKQLAIPISGPSLDRTPEAQAFYERTVAATARRVAHKNGADFSKQEVDGDQYAVITPNEGSSANKVDPIKGAFVAFQAAQAGMSDEDINANLLKHGYDEQDLDEINKRAAVISRAQEAGMTLEDIKQRFSDSQLNGETVESKPVDNRNERLMSVMGVKPKQTQYDKLVNTEEQMTAEELVSSLKTIHPTMVSDTVTTIPAYFGNKGAQQRYDVAREASRERIVNIAKENYGLDLVWAPGEVASEGWYAQTDEGLVEVTPGFWEDIKKSSGEITGGIAGAIAGAKIGSRAGMATTAIAGQLGPQAALPEELITVPAGGLIGGLIGAAAGGWTGAMAGSQVDYMAQALKLHEDMEGEAMAYKALNAFEAAAIGEAIGYPIVKGVGASWSHVVKAKDAILGGETRSAYRALKDGLFLSDDQIEEIVTQVQRHATLDGNKYERAIQAVAHTEPGMQDLVKAAAGTSLKSGAAAAHTVTRRADEVLAQTANLTDEQVPRMLTQDLRNYVGDVKQNYGEVKARATQSPRGLDFDWDFDELAIQPVLENLSSKITDPVTKEKFLLQMQRVNNMSESRTFGDLIELRQMTNDFLYNSRVVKADDKATLRTVLNNIDDAIEDGAGHVLEDPKQWLQDWSQARIDYSQMKQVEKTAMYRAMFNKDGTMRAVQPETVVKALAKHITSIDGSFESIMTKLPLEGRKRYEGAIVDSLTQKYTAGVDKGSKAIHFPMLADDLKKINFTTPDARATKAALLELSETFKNDVYLAQASGKITIPKFQSYLTADPVVRLKFEAASGIFNAIKSKLPGDSNRQLALVKATARLLDKPLDAKNFKYLQEELFDDANLSKQILELQQQAASDRMRESVGTPRVKVYPGGKLKGSGSHDTIPMHRILTLEQAREIAEAEALNLDSKALDSILKQYGFKAILQGSDRVRILGDK